MSFAQILGALGAIGGAAGGVNAAQNAGQGIDKNAGGPFRTSNVSRLIEFINLGGDANSLILDKGQAKKQKLRGGQDFFRLNKKKFRVISNSQLDDLRGKRESQALAAERRSFDKLKSSPFFQSLLGDVNGTSAGLAAAVTSLGNRTLGGAAQVGKNLEDPNVQARALGPGALQGFLAQRGLQRQAGLTGLQLTRGAGTPFASINPTGAAGALGQFYQGVNIGQGASAFNANASNSKNALLSGLYSGFGQSALEAGFGGN